MEILKVIGSYVLIKKKLTQIFKKIGIYFQVETKDFTLPNPEFLNFFEYIVTPF